MEKSRAKVIVITSGKGGVGKTTVTANLGICLAQMGKRVALIDVDFGLNNLDVVIGVENRVVYDILDVLDRRCRIKQALLEHPRYKNLFILPSNSIKTDCNITGQNLKVLIDNITPTFDYVLIDCPAGIDMGFHRAVSVADSAILVTTPTVLALRDADKVLTILKSYKLDNVWLAVNRARGDLMLRDKMIFPNDIGEILHTEIIGVMPEEDVVFLSSGEDLPKTSDSFKAYKCLAKNILKGSRNTFDVTAKYNGFWGSIKREIKRSI